MKQVFTEVVPLIPYNLNVYYYTGKKRTFLVLIGFDYSSFFTQKITCEALQCPLESCPLPAGQFFSYLPDPEPAEVDFQSFDSDPLSMSPDLL